MAEGADRERQVAHVKSFFRTMHNAKSTQEVENLIVILNRDLELRGENDVSGRRARTLPG